MPYINGRALGKIAIATAGAALAAGAIIKWRSLQILIKLVIKRIKRHFGGKDLIILGSKGVGKTTIHNFLRRGEITIHHNGTSRNKVPGNRFRVGELELIIIEGTYISGHRDNLREWKELFSKCDICIYVFDVRRVFDDDEVHIDFIDRHLQHIGQWNEENKNKDIYVFGLFLDQIKDLDIFSPNEIQDFKELINKKIKKSLLKAHITNSKFLIGSMKDKKSSEFLMERFLKRKRG